jgi:hypothetical protein
MLKISSKKQRLFLACLIAPSLAAAFWYGLESWLKEGGGSFSAASFVVSYACFFSLVFGGPLHVFLQRMNVHSIVAYFFAGGIIGMLMYFFAWFLMTWLENGMAVGAAIRVAFEGLGTIPISPLSFFFGALGGLFFWVIIKAERISSG